MARLVSIRPGLDRVLCDLAAIGYDAEWQIISANDVGAPHLRKRIWIIACPQSTNYPQQDGSSNTEGEDVEGRESEIRAESRGLRETVADIDNPWYKCPHCEEYSPESSWKWEDGKCPDCGATVADTKDTGLDGGERIKGNAQGKSESGRTVGTGGHGNRRSEDVGHSSSGNDGGANTGEIEGQVQESREGGSRGNVSNPSSTGLSDRGRTPLADTGEEVTESERQSSIRGGSQASSNPDSQRRRGRNSQRENAEDAGESSRREERGPWNFERELRRVAHELSQRLDKIGIEIINEEDERFIVQGLMDACEELGQKTESFVEIPSIWDSMSEDEQAWIVFRIATWNPWWSEWPDVPRVATGIKNRANRIKGLGNAVVPIIPYIIGLRLKEMYALLT